jgi:putative intracellular protease/amidase
MPGYALTDPDVPRAPKAVKALLLLDDQYGASVNIEDNQNNILENFKSYGWEVTLACCSEEVNPAPWASKQGCEVIHPDLMTYRLDNALDWDVIVVAPGESHQHLMDCPFVMSVLAQARDHDIPVAAWCQGVRVLAEADIIDGVEISGHADYEDDYLAAGAEFLGSYEPPTADQNIITCGDEKMYRQEMCELIRETVEKAAFLRETRARKAEKLEFKLCPNPISSSSEIAFCLEQEATVHIAVFDQQGHMVMDVVKQPFRQGKNSVTFNPSSLPTGIYYVYLFSNGKMGMQKCMII